MRKKKVLFVCIHNSARSQMAEALLNHLAADRFQAQSAGLEPGILNPLAIESMRRFGIDISHHKTKSVDSFLKRKENYDYVITVCDESSAAKCPRFPGICGQIHWAFDDPGGFQGTWEERLRKTEELRDRIKKQIEEWISTISI